MEVIHIDVDGQRLELGAQPSYGAFNGLCQGEDRTGLRLWARPARRVVKFLEDAPSLVRGKRVVELGCGALAALARASIILGAKSALATDGSETIVALARAHCAAAQLRFGEPCDAAPGATADLVLGSELLYYNTDLDALVATIAGQLSEDGVCVLCVVIRRHIKRQEAMFQGACRQSRSAAIDTVHDAEHAHTIFRQLVRDGCHERI